MAKKNKGGSVILTIGSIAAVIATGVIVCATVEPIRNKINSLIDDVKFGLKSEEEKNEIRQDATHEDEHYKELTEEEKKEFDDKLKTIFEHDDYKDLSDDEKNDLVEKFVESEKLQTVIKKEREEEKTRLENANSQLESFADQSQQLEEQIQELKDAGATEDEISKIEQKQQELEEQIKSVEQEKAYLETVDSVRETTNNNWDFSISNPEKTITKINGIFKYAGRVYIDVDILESETIGGVEFFSNYNAFCSIGQWVNENDGYEDILDSIAKTEFINFKFKYTNKNAQSHKEYFEQNKYLMSRYFKEDERLGYKLTVNESWENEGDSEHPEFIINVTKNEECEYYIVQYDLTSEKYFRQPIQKICPEFWAQLEVEQGKDAQSQSENNVKNVDTSLSTSTASQHVILDSNGEVQGFDYASYQKSMEEVNHSTFTTTSTSNSSYATVFDDLGLTL